MHLVVPPERLKDSDAYMAEFCAAEEAKGNSVTILGIETGSRDGEPYLAIDYQVISRNPLPTAPREMAPTPKRSGSRPAFEFSPHFHKKRGGSYGVHV